MNKLLWMVAVTSFFLVAAATAVASPQNPSKTPQGYAFCGWKDFLSGEWTPYQEQFGAYEVAFTRGMTCRP